MPIDLTQRFVEKIAEPFDPHNDCWVWTGSKKKSGYAMIRDGQRHVLVHRLSHELFIGPIPEGYHVDHLCRNRLCVRPDHLQALPPSENCGQFQREKTHCMRGHPFDEANTYRFKSGARRCRICYRLRKRGLV